MKKIKVLICLVMLLAGLNINISSVSALEEKKYGYLDINYTPEPRNINSSCSINYATQLPSSYNAKGTQYVSSIKNQNPYGTCWAFSYIALAESYMMKQKGALSDIDLSEAQLAYFLYNNKSRSLNDPLKNTKGDGVNTLGNDYWDLGGNSYFTSLWLSGFCGITSESMAPYVGADERKTYKLSDDMAYNHNRIVLKNAYFLSDESSTLQDEVKNIIYKNGAIGAAYYSKDSMYYNKLTASYYCFQEHTTNHAITIVGWDDSYSKTNFNKTNPPKKDGAWLVKNSWGKNYGKNGFIWISYEDKSLTDFISAEFDNASVYDHNYHYDGGLGLGSLSIYSGNKVANVYQVNGNENGGDEILKAVSFGLGSTDINYSIQIYKDITNKSNPQSGTPALSEPVRGRTTYAGIYTVDLNEDVRLKQGEYYSIVITFTNSKGNKIKVYCDNDADYSGFQTFNKTGYDQSFYISGNYAQDLKKNSNSESFSVRIKGLTVDVDRKSLKNIRLNKKNITMNVGEKEKLTYALTPSDAQNQLTWKSNNKNVLTVNNKGEITAISKGVATVTVADRSGLFSQCSITVNDIVDATIIQLNKNNLSLNIGEKETLNATIFPSNATNKNVIWSTSDEKVVAVKNGIITAKAIGTATITVCTSNGKKAMCDIKVIDSLRNKEPSIKTATIVKKSISKVSIQGVPKTKTYTGKQIKPSVKVYDGKTLLKNKTNYTISYGTNKATGKATIKIVGKGNYSGTITKTFYIVPKKVIISSVKPGKKQLTVKYKKVTGASGYQIGYSTSKSKGFKYITVNSKTVSKVIKKLKSKKNYYVKVRAYKSVGKKKYYGDYSSVKTVKIK